MTEDEHTLMCDLSSHRHCECHLPRQTQDIYNISIQINPQYRQRNISKLNAV